MITVRFSTGLSIQYNDANFAQRTPDYTDLYDKHGEGRKWIAQVPTHGCVIESVPACRVYNPISTANSSVAAEVGQLTVKVKTLSTRLGKVLKNGSAETR